MGKRIVIIDDDDAIRYSLTIVLEIAGHEVRVAETHDHGLALVRDFQPEVVLTDMTMPDVGGTEIITALTISHPSVRIIAMSGGGHIGKKDCLVLARENGAHATLAKPFDEDELLAAVDGGA